MNLLGNKGSERGRDRRGSLPGEAALRVGRAECVALLGPVGPARSALLRRARHAERPVEATALVTPDDPFLPGLDVGGNVEFPLRARRLDADERGRLGAEIRALARLEDVAGLAVDRIGHGARARLLLARALATGRALILLDDPARGLDEPERALLADTVRRIARLDRAAIVWATASRAEALAVADRIAVVPARDSPLRLDTVDALLAHPGTAEAARAVGEANLLVARITDAADPDDAEVVLSCGRRVPARLAEGVGAGDLALLAVPPGRIAFAAMPAERMGGDALPATLVERRHLGTHLRLRFRLEDGVGLVVHRPVGSLVPRDAARAAEPLGASLAWRPGDATAFPHPEA